MKKKTTKKSVKKTAAKTNNRKLTAAEIEKFKKLLLAKRREILGDVNHMEHETLHKSRSELSNVPFHMADQGTDNYEQEFTLELLDSERKVLRKIDMALERISEGVYGICIEGKERIPRARLEAIPWARYCVKCAEMIEKGIIDRGESYEDTGSDGE